MLELQKTVDGFPADVTITVQDAASTIVEYFVSGDEDKRLSVADADVLVASGGAPISFSELDTLLGIDDLNVSGSTFTVAATASEVQGRISDNLQQLLDLPVTIDVTDRATDKVTLDVTELAGLGVKFVETNNSVNLVDSVTNITGYTGTIAVNQVTLEAEEADQDLTGVSFSSYDGEQSTNLSANGFTGILLGADQAGVQVVGAGSYKITGTGDELSGLLAAHSDSAFVQGAAVLVLESGDLTVSVDAYTDAGSKIAEADHGSLIIKDTPSKLDAHNRASGDAFPEDATVVAEGSGDFSGLDLGGVESIVLTGPAQNLSVDHAAIVVAGSELYSVRDTGQEIEDNIATVDGADEVDSGDVLTLTVAEHKALDDDDTTLVASYKINDTAAKIMGEIQESSGFEGSPLDPSFYLYSVGTDGPGAGADARDIVAQGRVSASYDDDGESIVAVANTYDNNSIFFFADPGRSFSVTVDGQGVDPFEWGGLGTTHCLPSKITSTARSTISRPRPATALIYRAT